MKGIVKKTRTTYHHGNLRTALIDETERMVAANELDKVTLSELGQRLGVARSAPYRHFQSKQELLCEVAVRGFARMRDRNRAFRLDASKNVRERFRAIAHAYVEFAVANPDFYRVMYREDLVGENETPALLAVREETFFEMILLMEEGQREGVIVEGDPEAQVLFCWAPFHGMASFAIDQHFPADVFRGMLDWSIDSVLKGLSPD